MSFFMSADYSLSTKVMEIIYFIIGLLCIYCGVKNLKDKENPEPMGTFIFWAVLGVVLALGRWLPSLVSGILVVVMCIPAILKKVKKGAVSAATKAETEATYEKIGMKIFVPTLSIGMLAVICAITGLGIGLSVVKEIVDRHNGFVTVEGEKDKGACFTINLPLYTEEEEQKQQRKGVE